MRKTTITLTNIELDALLIAFENSAGDDEEISNLYNFDSKMIAAFHRVCGKLTAADYDRIGNNA